ncbi:MAG TPA: hypothetical protein VFS22_00710, partial [Flavisolibacter sp.]|nr:hypothetical protein [Flavisolibacter sp.]
NIARRDWVIFLSAGVMALALQMAIERWPAEQRHGSGLTNIERGNVTESVLVDKEEKDVIGFCKGIVFRCVSHLYVR